jgi:N-acetylneuraminic acid mutarotase
MGLLFDKLGQKSFKTVQVDLQNKQVSFQVTEGPRILAGRGSAAGGMVSGKPVVAGGSSWNADGTVKTFRNDTEIFENGEWKKGPDLPTGLAEGAFAQARDGLYLAGGWSAPDHASSVACRIVDIDGKIKVFPLPDLPQTLAACQGATADGKFFVICGQPQGQSATNRIWALDISDPNAKWVEKPSLPGVARAYPGVVECNGSLYIFGGLADGTGSIHDRTLRDAYRYDPLADRWNPLGNLSMPGYCWSAAPLDSKHILVAGRADGQVHDEVWLLDLETLNASRVGKAVIQATCAPLINVSENKWWLIGGEPDSHKHRTNRVSEISIP